MSLPRVFRPTPDGGVQIEPAEELNQLRINRRPIDRIEVAAESEQPIENVRGDSLELTVKFEPNKASEFGLAVRASPDGSERTVLSYDRAAMVLLIDFKQSTLDRGVYYPSFIFPPGGPNPVVSRQEAPFELKPNEPLRLRIFLDRSMLEVFANERQALTQRIYPSRTESVGVTAYSRGGPATLSGEAWDMAPANPW